MKNRGDPFFSSSLYCSSAVVGHRVIRHTPANKIVLASALAAKQAVAKRIRQMARNITHSTHTRLLKRRSQSHMFKCCKNVFFFSFLFEVIIICRLGIQTGATNVYRNSLNDPKGINEINKRNLIPTFDSVTYCLYSLYWKRNNSVNNFSQIFVCAYIHDD